MSSQNTHAKQRRKQSKVLRRRFTFCYSPERVRLRRDAAALSPDRYLHVRSQRKSKGSAQTSAEVEITRRLSDVKKSKGGTTARVSSLIRSFPLPLIPHNLVDPPSRPHLLTPPHRARKPTKLHLLRQSKRKRQTKKMKKPSRTRMKRRTLPWPWMMKRRALP